ncbi:hypothetical protein ACLOJK_008590 [Asimina triloba]
MKKKNFLFLLILLLLFSSPSSAVDFIFNGFDPPNITLFGNASLQSRILSITSDTSFSKGRALFPTKIPTKSSNITLPFSTSFIFAVSQLKSVLPGHGLAFLFAPYPGINGTSSSQHLGLFNGTNNGDPTNHVFAVEFDVFQNPEFNDIDANHVGLDLNSLASDTSHAAGYWTDGAAALVNYTINDGHNYQVWIDYQDFVVNVTMARVGSPRPARPLISAPVNLSAVLLDEMYVGFCAATGQLVQSHRVLAWSFSNSNLSAHQSLITSNLPSFVPKRDSGVRTKAFIAGVSVGAVVLVGAAAGGAALFWTRRRRREKEKEKQEETEDWELEYWPHRIPYRKIVDATNGFSEANVIGVGGNGKVYKGVMAGGAEIAVKCISHDSREGMKEFLAEVSSLGRLKHRSLVRLKGWCKSDRASLMVVYDFMENGSLDKRIFDCGEDELLQWDARIQILKDVGNGLMYLHEGWEVKVLHRDIKASNVMLDKQMNGKLGDFGLARMHGHGQALTTTGVVGTVGYMAAEFLKSGKATAKTDVYGFGVLILEVLCGRHPVENGEPGLVDWVWGMMEQGRLVVAVDRRLLCKNWAVDAIAEEAERVLQLGLLCTYPDPHSRPTMRQAMKMLEGSSVEGLEDGDGEAMDAYLLSKLEPKNWYKHSRCPVYGSYPVFEEIYQSMSSTATSLSASDIILEGR